MASRICPHCGSEKVVANVTVRWKQARATGAFHSERGLFCTACGKGFRVISRGGEGFRTVRVGRMTPALSKLQQSGDLVVVRHRNGVTEVVF